MSLTAKDRAASTPPADATPSLQQQQQQQQQQQRRSHRQAPTGTYPRLKSGAAPLAFSIPLPPQDRMDAPVLPSADQSIEPSGPVDSSGRVENRATTPLPSHFIVGAGISRAQRRGSPEIPLKNRESPRASADYRGELVGILFELPTKMQQAAHAGRQTLRWVGAIASFLAARRAFFFLR